MVSRHGVYRISLILLTVLAGACSSKAPEQPKAKPVARLVDARGSVHHRSAKTLAWRSARRQMLLLHRDALKTAEGARARVRFVTGAELEIEEQSLVVIEMPEVPKKEAPEQPDKPPAPVQVARVEQGTIRGVVKPGAPPVRVMTPGGEPTEIQADGDQEVPFRIRVREGGKLEVAVLKGSARVRSGRREVRLTPRQVVDVTDKQISKPVELLPYPELTVPQVDAKVEAGAEMELGWKPVEGAAMYRVQLSHMVNFVKRLYDTTVVVPRFRLPAPRAMRTYVWRVSSVDPAGRESEFGFARRFHVKSAKPPDLGQMLYPPDNAGIQYVGQPRPVTFRWKGEADSYQVVVARDPSLTRRVVARSTTSKTYFEMKTLRSGTYYWGVFVRQGGQSKPLFERAHKLVIARRLPPHVKVPESIDWK